jgi:hypothetical protein
MSVAMLMILFTEIIKLLVSICGALNSDRLQGHRGDRVYRDNGVLMRPVIVGFEYLP